MHTYQQHRGPVLQILYSPDGRHMYSAGEDGHICVYDVQRGYQPVKMVASDTCSERENIVPILKFPPPPPPSTSTSTIEGVHVLPLYARLSQTKQGRIFDPTPAGKRLIVISTNVKTLRITELRHVPLIKIIVKTDKINIICTYIAKI